MARIGESEVERIKAEISLARMVEAAGIELKGQGKNLLGRCPFHDDKTPSLVVTPERNLWHCLGACQTGGSVIDWVMKAEGVSFRHAVELLRERYFPSLVAETRRGSAGADGRAYPKQSSVRKLEEIVEPRESDAVVLGRVVGYYHEQLKQSPEAQEYLRSRGLGHPELIERFQLGFANRTLGYRLPAKHVKAGEAIRERLQELGVLRASGHEHLNGSVVFPIKSERGEVVELYGRKVTKGLRKGTARHLYLPGPHRGVWNLEALKASRQVILCESLIDAATFWCAGLRNVTSAYGVSGFTEDHWGAFREHGVERVLIAYDRDAAGDKAAESLSAELNAAGIETARVLFPKGMDASEYAQRVAPADKSLRLAVQNAQWLGRGRAAKGPFPTPAAPGPLPGEEAVAAIPVASKEVSFSSLAAEASESEGAEAAVAESGEKLTSLAAQQGRKAGSEEGARGGRVSRDEVTLEQGDRRWRVRGLLKNTSLSALRVGALVSRGEAFHVDTLELYSARQRGAYIKQASEELGVEERVIKADLGRLLLRLEQLQDEAQREPGQAESAAPKMSEAEQEEALSLLRDPKLLERIEQDLERCGVVGERVNKLSSYLAATSRKLERPLAVVIQSSSAAGKSSLMEAVLKLVPEEEKVAYSAMTAQSLFYMGERDLKHKVLAIAEEEGAREASYALKLLQSEGRVRIAATTKDAQTGQFVTKDHELEGPVMLFLTTTAIEVDEELLNRCVVLSVDEGRAQTRAIHEQQRHGRTLAGMLEREERERLVRLHQNAQRLLRSLPVVNPYASELTFPDHQTRMRRDHTKYLGLIESVALLHQYQRPIKEVEHRGEKLRYVEVTRADIETANGLAREVLGRSVDELPPQTRRLLEQVTQLVREESARMGVEASDYRFTRRMVRERVRWGDTQLKVHLGRLVELELLLVHRGHHSQRFQYELAYGGGAGPVLGGLREAAGRGVVGVRSAPRGDWFW